MESTVQLAPTRATAAPGNPWKLPPLDPAVAQRALDGLAAGVTAVNRLIDRSIAVRVLLDRDLATGTFAPDTVRAVHLLTRARDYASRELRERHLSQDVLDPIDRWARTSGDMRVRVVGDQAYALRRAVYDLLDDDEGNVDELIASMRTTATRSTWQSVRDAVDGSIGELYGARDVGSARHVLRVAGGLA